MSPDLTSDEAMTELVRETERLDLYERQQREHRVSCRTCKRWTWAVDARCELCKTKEARE